MSTHTAIAQAHPNIALMMVLQGNTIPPKPYGTLFGQCEAYYPIAYKVMVFRWMAGIKKSAASNRALFD